MSPVHILTLIFLALLCARAAHAGVAPESPTTEVRTANPGGSYRGTIILRNAGKSTADIKLYQTDYCFSADGRSDFASPGTLPRSNASWLRLSREQITIPGGERATIEYEVSIPDDARLTGTYWSALMVEQLSGEEARAEHRRDVRLRQVMRYAIQVITEIGATGKSEIAFRNAHLLTGGGKRQLAVDVENTGERWLQTQVWLELHDTDGRFAGKFSGQNLRTFPATSVRNRIDLTGVPPGRYLALLVADGGRNDLFGTQIDLDLR
jgi:hypothetical protein